MSTENEYDQVFSGESIRERGSFCIATSSFDGVRKVM